MRKRAPAQAATDKVLVRKRPATNRQVSLKATNNDGGSAVKAVLHKKPADDASRKLRQKPVLKLEWALKRIRGNVEHARNGYREKLYVAYAECCEMAFRLKQNSSEWEEFCSLPFWMQRGRMQPELKIDDALRLVLINTVYGLSRSQQKTASKVAIALKAYTDGAYDAQEIVDLIRKNRGIGKLARQNAAPSPAKKPKTSEDESSPAQETKISLMGVPLADVLKQKPNTKFRLEVMMAQDASGEIFLKCLSLDKIYSSG